MGLAVQGARNTIIRGAIEKGGFLRTICFGSGVIYRACATWDGTPKAFGGREAGPKGGTTGQPGAPRSGAVALLIINIAFFKQLGFKMSLGRVWVVAMVLWLIKVLPTLSI